MTFSTSQIPTVALRDGEQIPQLGFGVFQVPPEETNEAVLRALEAGYRHIDTAAAYRNEAAVGQAIRESGIPREDVFVTTKCFNNNHGHDEATAHEPVADGTTPYNARSCDGSDCKWENM